MKIQGSYRSLLTLLITATVTLFTLTANVYSPVNPVRETTVEQVDGHSNKGKSHLRVSFRTKFDFSQIDLQWILAELDHTRNCSRVHYSLAILDGFREMPESLIPNFSNHSKEPPHRS